MGRATRSVATKGGWLMRFAIGILFLLAFQGVQCEHEPTESECRPYIEKALKEHHVDEVVDLSQDATSIEQEENPPIDDTAESNEEQTTSTESGQDTTAEDAGDSKEGEDENKTEETATDGGDEATDQDGSEGDSQETDVGSQEGDTAEAEAGSQEGDTAEAEAGSQEGDNAEGDAGSQEGDTAEGEAGSQEGDTAEAETDSKEGDTAEGDAGSQEGDTAEAEAGSQEGDTAEAEAGSQEGDTAEAEAGSQEGDTAEAEAGSQEGDTTEAEAGSQEGDTTENEAGNQEGDTAEAEAGSQEGDTAETEAGSGEAAEGDASDPGSIEGDTAEAAESQEKETADDAGSQEGDTAEAEGSSQEGDVAAESEDTQETGEEPQEEEQVQADEGESKSTEEGAKQDSDSEEAPGKAEGSVEETQEDSGQKEEVSQEATEEAAGAEGSQEGDQEVPEEDLTKETIIPANLRSRDHITQILKLDEESMETESILARTTETTLKNLKNLYDSAIKPLEILYKYRDLSNRHFGDPEIFSKPLVLLMGPWSGGKSSTINYLLNLEFTELALRTGAEPSPAYFNILTYGDETEILDGTQLAADWTFSGLQKFGQGLLDRLRGVRLPNRLLEKVNIVEIPGILEIRKQVQRLFPFNDACQWFIDRADIIFLVYDPAKLDVGPETEAILDQLKGREYQTRIILNKADQVKPEELMRVQGTLIWNISPLMSSQEPPVMYTTSLWSLPYESTAPARLLLAQERALLRDLRDAIDRRVENKIASARRFAVRVRNHAKMVDCYLTTYYNHKTFFGNRKKISDDIIENPTKYHIYEGLSTLTNISRYDLPDPEMYRDFFRINPLYEFTKLSDTCTYFRGCPINKLDVAIAYDLPELVGKYKKAHHEAKSALEGKTNS